MTSILPDLLLLALVLAFIVSRGTRSTRSERAPVRSAASKRSQRSAARAASRRRLSSVALQPEGARSAALQPTREETRHGQP